MQRLRFFSESQTERTILLFQLYATLEMRGCLSPHPRPEALHALPRWTRAQIPVAILPVVVRSEAVAQEVEVFLPRVAQRSLRFVYGKPELGHYLPRPRQSLFRVSAA